MSVSLDLPYNDADLHKGHCLVNSCKSIYRYILIKKIKNKKTKTKKTLVVP